MGIFGIEAGRHILLAVKSPQFGLILPKGGDQDRSRSREIANYRSLFLKYRVIMVFIRKEHD